MSQVRIVVRDVTKQFDRRTVLENISFEIGVGQSLAITGPNGSGKSTLMKIIARALTPTSGLVEYHIDGRPADDNLVRETIGFVSPYLQLYDEFTALENLEILNGTRLVDRKSQSNWLDLLAVVNLADRKNDLVRGFSSGMKQRLKYALALSHAPVVLLLDEPTANLDDDGIRIVRHIINEHSKRGILILATNSMDEAMWCERTLHLQRNW